MKISNVNTFAISPQNGKSNVRFTGEPETVKDDDGKEYVKVPKSEYNRDKWGERIFWALLVFEIIYALLTRKSS